MHAQLQSIFFMLLGAAIGFPFGAYWRAGYEDRRRDSLSDRPLPRPTSTGFASRSDGDRLAATVHRCMCGHVLAEHSSMGSCKALVVGGCPCAGFISEDGDA